MSDNRYYYYDPESGNFVEAKPKQTNPILMGTIGLAAVLMLVIGIIWGTRSVGLVDSTEEVRLANENEVLREQLGETEERIDKMFAKLDDLYEKDAELYRTLLNADPISEDVREVGVGGTEDYLEFEGYSDATTAVLKRTAQMVDKLERQINLQNSSYGDLIGMAETREMALKSKPAILPVDKGRITSGFGSRRHPIYGGYRHHDGVDIVVPVGTPVYATGDGVISFTGRKGGYGITVEMTHGATGYETLYAHLSRIPGNITPGTRVKRGDLIAYSGNTGASTAPHVHYEVHKISGEKYDPMMFIAPGVSPSTLREMLRDSESDTAMLEGL